MLESENAALKQKVCTIEKAPLRLEGVMHDDNLVKMYTGFPSYELLVAFLIFWDQSTTGELKMIFIVVKRTYIFNPFNCIF